MTDEKIEDWNFYFGRGGDSNKKRKVSKANDLLTKLAHRYYKCSQSEKRIFAKKEVFDTVIKNGGKFLNMVNKEPVDVTSDVDESIKKIMQHFRDLIKLSKTSVPTPDPVLVSYSQKTKRTPRTTTMASSLIMPPPRPKRLCVKPSVVEVPTIQCVRQALKSAKTEQASVDRYRNTSVKASILTVGGKGPAQSPLGQKSPLRFAPSDVFETLPVEPPKLEESFSALIMADEMTAELPTDSQKNVNQNLHERVQRLENLVGMLMQQKDENFSSLL